MSADQTRNPVPPQILSGWKEIANYLGKGVRTVQRYEVELRLPVRRPAGKSYGAVVATKVELDAWVNASPIREAFHLARTTTEETAVRDIRDMRNTVLEMRDLRSQMAGLRAELRNSVQQLKQGISIISGELNGAQLDEDAVTKVSVLEPRFRTTSILQMLATDLNHKKPT